VLPLPPSLIGFGGATSDKGNSGPFYVGSGLAIVSAILVLFLKPLSADGMKQEDEEVRKRKNLSPLPEMSLTLQCLFFLFLFFAAAVLHSSARTSLHMASTLLYWAPKTWTRALMAELSMRRKVLTRKKSLSPLRFRLE
jgi:hypothetical protein